MSKSEINHYDIVDASTPLNRGEERNENIQQQQKQRNVKSSKRNLSPKRSEREVEEAKNVEIKLIQQQQPTTTKTTNLRDNKKKENEKKKGCYKKMGTLLESHTFHIVIIVLIVIDCMCVLGEIFIDYIDIVVNTVPKTMQHSSEISQNHNHNHNEIELKTNNHSSLSSSSSHQHQHGEHRFLHPSIHEAFELMEEFFKYLSLIILTLFMIELVLKLTFIPRIFLKHKLEIMDAFVVVISFVVAISLVRVKHVIHSFSGLLTILRLWRITEIVNNVLVLNQQKNEIKMEELNKRIESYKKCNEQLSSELNELKFKYNNIVSLDRL